MLPLWSLVGYPGIAELTLNDSAILGLMCQGFSLCAEVGSKDNACPLVNILFVVASVLHSINSFLVYQGFSFP